MYRRRRFVSPLFPWRKNLSVIIVVNYCGIFSLITHWQRLHSFEHKPVESFFSLESTPFSNKNLKYDFEKLLLKFLNCILSSLKQKNNNDFTQTFSSVTTQARSRTVTSSRTLNVANNGLKLLRNRTTVRSGGVSYWYACALPPG